MKTLLSFFSVSLLGIWLSGCTTALLSDAELPMSSSNRCAGSAGVSVRYHTVTIALGERPHTGYGIELVGQQQKAGEYRLLYRETLPQPGMQYAQMLVSPCLQVVLPRDWSGVTVIHQDTGRQWRLTPADDAGVSKQRS